jgi:hypothetical protein
MSSIYLDDYSQEDLIYYENNPRNYSEIKHIEKPKNKANIELQPDFNKKGEKVALFRLTLPVQDNALKIDIIINDELYKKIGEQFKK